MVEFSKVWQSVPPLIQWATAIIGVFWIGALAYLIRDLKVALSVSRAFGGLVAKLPQPTAAERLNGLALEHFNAMSEWAHALPDAPRAWWQALSDCFVEYPVGDRKVGFFLSRPPRELLTEDVALGRHYHAAFHHSVPGLLTGIGLASTFLAILLALLGVTYDAADKLEPVKGIAGLINGLSGKFSSSVVALVLAVFFTVIEKVVSRVLTGGYDRVLARLERQVPLLTAERLLLDIRRTSQQQAVSLSNISSDIVDRFVTAFQSDMSPRLATGLSSEMALKLEPTLDRMNETLSELKAALQRLEAQKQESITGELRGLLEALQTSMQASLAEMGRTFHESLAGAARDEFGSVEGSLKGTAEMLSNMNARFAELQAALGRIIEKAESTTSGQLEAGREQVSAMTNLMNGLMLKMQEASSANIEGMGARLTLVVDDLSRRVGGLSQELLTATRDVAASSQASAGQVIQQAGAWSEATSQRLEALVAAIEVRSQEFEKAAQTLREAQTVAAATLAQNQTALRALGDASVTVAAYAKSLSGHSQELKTMTAEQRNVNTVTSQSAALLKAAMEEHRKLLTQHEAVVQRYQAILGTLDQKLAAVFETALRGLENYTQVSEQNFRAIVQMANEAVPKIADILQAQTSELREHLEELNDILGRGLERLEKRVSGDGQLPSPRG